MCIFRAIPLLVVIPAIGFIAKTSSLLTAISELNLEVVRKSPSVLRISSEH